MGWKINWRGMRAIWRWLVVVVVVVVGIVEMKYSVDLMRGDREEGGQLELMMKPFLPIVLLRVLDGRYVSIADQYQIRFFSSESVLRAGLQLDGRFV
jgi:hypothetical protein